MKEEINQKLEEIENHIDNIKVLTWGLCDKSGRRLLHAVNEAERSLRKAHTYLVDPKDLDIGEDLWDT
jgi:hypothetical protein